MKKKKNKKKKGKSPGMQKVFTDTVNRHVNKHQRHNLKVPNCTNAEQLYGEQEKSLESCLRSQSISLMSTLTQSPRSVNLPANLEWFLRV